MAMTSREIIRAIVRDKICPERMGLQESYWPELSSIWEPQGLPAGVSLPDYFGLDLRAIGDEWISTDAFVDAKRVIEEDEKTYVEENGWGARMRYWKGRSGTPEHLSFALTSEQVWRTKLRDCFLTFDPGRLGDIERRKSEFRRLTGTDRFCVYEVLQVFEIMRRSMGDVIMLEAMCLNPSWIHDFCQVLTDNIIMHLEYELNEVGLPDGIWFYEDLAYTQAPFLSPAMYRDLILPYHRRFVEFCHERALPVIMHTCGNVRPLFPGLLETGIDCLQPLEAKTGQNVIEFAQSATRPIAFMGNIDIRALDSNDPARVEAEIVPKLKAIREQKIPYVFHSDHSIPGSVRFSTYEYALELFRTHGRY